MQLVAPAPIQVSVHQAALVVRVRLQDLHTRRRDAQALGSRAPRLAHGVAQGCRRLALPPAAVHMLHLQRRRARRRPQPGVKSIHQMMRALLPCGKMQYPPYALDGTPFSFYDRPLLLWQVSKGGGGGKGAADWRRRRGAEGVRLVGVFGDTPCPLEASSEPFSWEVWEPSLRGKNADGEPSYSDELVPKHGTRAEFMQELRQAIEAFLPHWWDHVMMQRGIKVHEAHKDSVTATIRSDYAAQIKTLRVHNSTCASPETHNLCVTVVGHSPYDEVVHTKQHGKRPASTRTVRKQRVSVFFGFHPASFKPSARTFNVLREASRCCSRRARPNTASGSTRASGCQGAMGSRRSRPT